jgi:hypothetical protein
MSQVPRLNHVAMSMDPKVLDEQGRADVLAFYGEVFGWSEGDNTGEKGNPLIMMTGAFGEFIYLLPGDPETGEHMRTPALDHFGFMVRTRDQLDEILDRAKRYADKDDRVHIIDVHQRAPQGGYKLTNAYIGYLLPLMVELQYLETVERSPSEA